MDFKNFCKAFMSGMVFPAVFLPLAYTALYCCIITNIKDLPVQFIPMYIPLLFGITNCIHLWMSDKCPIKDNNLRLWVTGATLGLIVAILGIFVFDIPHLLFNFSGMLNYLPMVFLPVIYGAIFRYIINWLNAI